MELIGYLGTMNSMKSATALMRAYKYNQDGEKCIAFKHEKDTRDGEYIASRALGSKLKARVIKNTDLGVMYKICKEEKPNHVIVDEVQFFNRYQIGELAEIAKKLGIRVECYGLKVDFQTNLFEGSKRLIELADRIETFENECSIKGCYMPATQNLRKENGLPVFHGEQVKVGKEESYMAVCLGCYIKLLEEEGRNVQEAVVRDMRR